MTDRIPGFATLAIHAGAQPDPTTGARATPIYQTTSFVFEDVDHAASLFGLQTFGNIYTRIGNPTNAVLEERVAALEGGTAGLAVASGHAAQVVAMHCLMQPGEEFVASKKLYGGSINQFNHAFKNFGWNVVWADPDDVASFERGVGPKTKAIFVESIANPGGVITDIEAIAKIAKSAGVPLLVDNTLATPYLCKPIEINQFNHAFKNFGWNVVWADPDDVASFERGVGPKTKAIFVESIANPGGVITDIEAIAKIAKSAGVPLLVDNTLATPYLCKPI